MPVVDLHAHWFPQPWIDLLLKEAEGNGAKMGKNEKGHPVIDVIGVPLKSVFRPDMVEPDAILKSMNDARVDVRAMSLTNPMVYWAPPAFGLKLSRAYNDACVALHQAHPDRFLGTIMLPHAGGTFPWLIGRYDRGAAVRKELAHMKRPPSAYLRRFYYDTVSHHPQLIRFLIDLVGADRVVVGSDYNFDMGYEQPVEFVEQVPGLTERERKLILRENAARLLRL